MHGRWRGDLAQVAAQRLRIGSLLAGQALAGAGVRAHGQGQLGHGQVARVALALAVAGQLLLARRAHVAHAAVQLRAVLAQPGRREGSARAHGRPEAPSPWARILGQGSCVTAAQGFASQMLSAAPCPSMHPSYEKPHQRSSCSLAEAGQHLVAKTQRKLPNRKGYSPTKPMPRQQRPGHLHEQPKGPDGLYQTKKSTHGRGSHMATALGSHAAAAAGC